MTQRLRDLCVLYLTLDCGLKTVIQNNSMPVTMCPRSPQISMQESKVKSPWRLGGSLMKATIIKRWLVLNKAIITIIKWCQVTFIKCSSMQ